MKVTDIVETPEGHSVLATIGSYKFTTNNNDAMYLIGFNNKMNLSKEKISPVSIMPIDSRFKWEDGVPIDHEIEDGIVYYMCSFKNQYFLFEDIVKAIDFIAYITEFKAIGIQYSINNQKVEGEKI